MTVTTTWRTGEGIKRYVRHVEGPHFAWIEVGADRRYDCARGVCDIMDIPADIAQVAKDRAGIFPSYVEWPL